MTLSDTIRAYVGAYAQAVSPELFDAILDGFHRQAAVLEQQQQAAAWYAAERIFWLSEALEPLANDECEGCVAPTDICPPDNARWMLEHYGAQEGGSK